MPRVQRSISGMAWHTGRVLAEAISSAGVAVTKSEIRLPDGPIRAVGEYDVGVQLHTDIAATIKVFIEAE